jgi:hypothetical protein
MVARPKALKRAPVDDVKPLAEERKNLIERYTVDDAQAERLARRRQGEPEAPAAEAKPSVQEAKTGAAAESYPTAAMTAETISDRRAVVEASRFGAAADEAPASLGERAGPAAEADEERDTSRPQGAGSARRQGAEADEAPAGVDEQPGPAAEADEKRGSSRPQRARRARRQGAEADEAPAGVDDQAAPAAEADEERLADEQARLAAEAEVRHLTEELARLAAEAEAMRAGPQPPQLDAAAEAVRTVEAQRTLKAVAAPIDVPPVEQTEVCYVARWRGYLTCEFFARRPDGAIVATSGTFRWRKSDPPPEDGPAREAFDRLVAELLAYGWEESGRGALWYERHFERPAHSTPSEREAAAVTRSGH